jgi:hypothetical protein
VDITDLKIVSQRNRVNWEISLQARAKVTLTPRELVMVPEEYYWRGLILAVRSNVRKNNIVISFCKLEEWGCDTCHTYSEICVT